MTILMMDGAYPTETFATGPYQIDWYTIDGGGGTSTGGRYVLTGTIGQPDAGYSADARYELLGGFWPGGAMLCIVYFDELARFCDYWLERGTGISADLDADGNVDMADYSILADSWLKQCSCNWLLE
jgi:hypothetical protein